MKIRSRAATPPEPDSTIYSYNHQNPHASFERPKMPVGLFVIAGIALLSAIFTFLNAPGSNSSGISSVLSIVIGLLDILLGVGLLLRLEFVRKIVIVTSAVIMIFSSGSILLMRNIQSELQAQSVAAHAAINKARLSATTAQSDNLKKLEVAVNQADADQEELDVVLARLYAIMGFYVVWHGVIIVYVMRPKVKEGFRKLQ